MNAVKAVRLARRMMKKDVLDRSVGILTPHRLNQIEAGKGWRPRADEKASIAQILDCPENVLFPE
ncbi:MAG: hypothetical protein Q8M54_00415 [Desulfobaccales bacterium]|nr:hypothetical protein [Desulfobaccales bacterium]